IYQCFRHIIVDFIKLKILTTNPLWISVKIQNVINPFKIEFIFYFCDLNLNQFTMFKKLLFFATLLASMASFGQEVSFGAQAGYLNMESKATYDSFSVSDDVSGFYVGALADFTLTEDFHLQPSVNYANADDMSFLI